MELIKSMSQEEIDALCKETWWCDVKWGDLKIIDLFTQSWITSSNGEAKKLVQSGSLYCNENKITDLQQVVNEKDFVNWILLLRKGKKVFKVVKSEN
jgi:tyrosyl-tRNA synthetase